MKICHDKNPDSEETNENLANFYLGLRDYENAIKIYKKTIEKYPNNIEALSNIGISYLMINKLDESLEELKKAYEINSESFELMRLIGEIYYRKDMIEKAIPLFERSIEIEPIDGADRIHYYLGKSYQKIKDFEKSLFHLKESEIYEENAYWKEDYLDVLFHLRGIDNFKKEFEDIYQELDEEGNKSVIFNKIKDNSEGS